MTPRQRDLFTFIKGYIARTGYSPSFEEMRVALGLASKSSIHTLISALRRDGFLARPSPGSARSAVVVESWGALDDDVCRRQRNVAYQALVDIRDGGRTATF